MVKIRSRDRVCNVTNSRAIVRDLPEEPIVASKKKFAGVAFSPGMTEHLERAAAVGWTFEPDSRPETVIARSPDPDVQPIPVYENGVNKRHISNLGARFYAAGVPKVPAVKVGEPCPPGDHVHIEVVSAGDIVSQATSDIAEAARYLEMQSPIAVRGGSLDPDTFFRLMDKALDQYYGAMDPDKRDDAHFIELMTSKLCAKIGKSLGCSPVESAIAASAMLMGAASRRDSSLSNAEILGPLRAEGGESMQIANDLLAEAESDLKDALKAAQDAGTRAHAAKERADRVTKERDDLKLAHAEVLERATAAERRLGALKVAFSDVEV